LPWRVSPVPQSNPIPEIPTILLAPSPEERPGPIFSIPPCGICRSRDAVPHRQQGFFFITFLLAPHAPPIMCILDLAITCPHIFGTVPRYHLLLWNVHLVMLTEPYEKTFPHFDIFKIVEQTSLVLSRPPWPRRKEEAHHRPKVLSAYNTINDMGSQRHHDW
jgi:hypothetical protein